MAAVHHKLIGFGDIELQVIFVDAPCDVAPFVRLCVNCL